MRFLPFPFILALLLMPWVLGPAPAGQGPGVMLGPCCDAAAAAGVSEGQWGLGFVGNSPLGCAVLPACKSFFLLHGPERLKPDCLCLLWFGAGFCIACGPTAQIRQCFWMQGGERVYNHMEYMM